MSIGFKVEGLDKVLDRLNNMSDNSAGALKQQYMKIAEDIASDARSLAPTDTGHLKQNIFSRVFEENETIVGEVYSDVEYAAYVEFGTGSVGESAGLQREGLTLAYRQTPWRYRDEEGNWHYTHGMKPQPYLYPAMKNHEDSIKELSKGAVVKLEVK